MLGSGGFETFAEWYRENSTHFTISSESNNIKYEIEIRPKVTLAYIKAKKEGLTYKAFKQSVSKGKEFKINLSISHNKGQVDLLKMISRNTAEYNMKLDYINHELKKDLLIINTKGDTITSIDHHHERTYGVGGKLQFSFTFEEEGDIDKILFQDNIIQGCNALFDFKENIINKIKY